MNKVTVCQTCGDSGFSVALIYCDKCQAYAVHRYCLYNLPKSFEEYVFWFCVDCEPKFVESSIVQQALPATDGKSKGKNDIKKKKMKKKKKKKSQNDFGALALVEVQRQSSPLLPPVENPEKDGTSRGLLAVGVANSSEEKLIEAKTSPLNSFSRGSDSVNINGLDCGNHNMSIVAINEQLDIKGYNSLDPGWRVLDSKYSSGVVECGNDVAPVNQIPVHVYVPAQPVVESIWRGSFHLSLENLTIGVVAHLSSLACLKVCETANCLPQLLQLELLPRFDVWPKGFKQGGPSDESIALYFFPSDQREVEIFDGLMYRMMYQDLGIKVAIEDVELLVYSSNVLPLHFQRFRGKFYLWGVFRGKQSSNLTYGVHGEEKNFTKALSCDSHSPVSPLCDNGSHDSKQSLPVELYRSETSENFQGKNLGTRSKTSEIIGPCSKCGSKDHFIKDCPRSGIGAIGTCEHCNAYHSGKCWKITGACLKCGSNDHKIRDCPKMVGGGPTSAPNFTSKSIPSPKECGPGRGSAYGSRIPVCEHCHVSHWGKCRKKFGACWNCGSKEHFVRNCPKI